LLTEISDEEINANKMFYLHLDDLKDENDSESDDDEDSNWDPNDIIADNMAIE